MILAIVVFLLLFGLVVIVGLAFSSKTPISRRVEDVVAGTNQRLELDLTRGRSQRSNPFAGLLERVGTSVPQGQNETTAMRQNLIRAGYRDASAVSVLYGIKVVFPLLLLALVVFAWRPSSFLPYIAALGLGYLLPDIGLQRVIRIRENKIRKGLPDALDLLVICVEAGLSLDQALSRTTKELGVTHPELSDELNLVVLEQAAGAGRGEAWKHFADRTKIDSVRHLVTTIVQAEQFGTSIAKTLRVHSETMRLKRKQMLEEAAAKTSVKLVFPLVLFIFPSILLVTLGPALISIYKTLPKLIHHS